MSTTSSSTIADSPMEEEISTSDSDVKKSHLEHILEMNRVSPVKKSKY